MSKHIVCHRSTRWKIGIRSNQSAKLNDASWAQQLASTTVAMCLCWLKDGGVQLEPSDRWLGAFLTSFRGKAGFGFR